MKILALSDVHGDTSFMRKMAQKGADEQVDLVLLAGDLVADDGSLDGLVGPFVEKGLEVGLINGNHEGRAETAFLATRYGVKELHGYSLRLGEVGIFACGYGDVGIHQLTEDAFFKTLKEAHEAVKDAKVKIMLTHVQPSESVIGMHINGWGSTGVRKAIEDFKPDLHICGHIHETHGMEETIGSTRVINVGKTGTIIEISKTKDSSTHSISLQ